MVVSVEITELTSKKDEEQSQKSDDAKETGKDESQGKRKPKRLIIVGSFYYCYPAPLRTVLQLLLLVIPLSYFLSLPFKVWADEER